MSVCQNIFSLQIKETERWSTVTSLNEQIERLYLHLFCLFVFIFTRAVLLVGDQPHDGPVFRKHFWSDQDPEDCEDLKEEVLECTNTHAGVMLIIENSDRDRVFAVASHSCTEYFCLSLPCSH